MLFRTRSGRRARFAAALLAAALTTAGAPLALPAAAAADPGVEPSTVNLTLGPGGSADVAKVVHTPTVPPKPDVVFLADTTGSMGGAIGNVRSNAAAILSEISSNAGFTAQFAAAEYRDFGDAFAFRVNQNLTDDDVAVQAGINQWVAGGGGDTPEANLNALFQVATGAISFRPDSTRIVVIFGDAPSHDPSGGHSLADTIAALQAPPGVRVVAVDVGAMNSTGQFTAITDATGGQLLSNVPANEVAAAIVAGIKAIEVTVTPKVVSCDPGLSLSFAPGSRTVTSGEDAGFTEHVQVAGGAAAGNYQCTVDFLVDGASRGFIQHLTVGVPGLTINDVEVNEAAGQATFTVTRTGPTNSTVTVNYGTANGTATPADYTPTNGTLTFAPGQVTRTISVPIIDDTIDEPAETFTVVLSAAVGAALVDPTGVGRIIDNDRNGTFSCQATALKVAGLTAAQANPADVPCVDDHKAVAQASLNAGLVSVRTSVLDARTDQTPNSLVNTLPALGDSAVSTARVDSTRITVGGLVTIELGVIQARASATCAVNPGGLDAALAGSSTIASLKINGVTVVIGSGPVTIPLVVGSLKLNSTEISSGRLVQRAVVLDTLLTDVVVGEARANVEGNPCRV